MKKYYFIIALLVACSIFVWSCKKDHKQLQPVETSNKKTYNVTIGVSGGSFTQQITNATSNKIRSLATAVSDSAALAGLIDKLYIYITDNQFRIKYKFTQTKSDVDFGTVKITLPPDNYRLYIFGCKDGVTVTSSDGTTNSGGYVEFDAAERTNGASHYIKSWPESFSCNALLEVQSADVNKIVTLTRPICQVKVVIKDALPASVKSIKLSSRPSLSSYNLFSGTFYYSIVDDGGANVSVAIPDSLIGKKNFSLYVNTGCDTSYINRGNYISSEINCYGNNNNSLIVARSLGSVFLYGNQQVIYTIDSMFGGITTPQNASFQVSVNTGWKPTVITQSF
jgi:hypothetical protein